MASVLLAGALVLHWMQMHQVRDYLLVAATVIEGLPIAVKAMQSLRAKMFSIEFLLTISLSGATIIGEYTEAAVLGFLFIAGVWLETRALRRMRHSLAQNLDELAQRFPDEAFVELVEEAQESGTGAQRFLQRLANIYTPVVVVVAAGVYLVSGNLQQALTFLVIACPGALVISVPVALAAGVSIGARSGVLMKDGNTIEKLAGIDAVLFTEYSLLKPPEAKRIVEHLRAEGVKQAGIVSGDGIASIKQLKDQGYRVAVVGSPVHDAAVLAAADIGVALGATAAGPTGMPDVMILSGQAGQFCHAYGLSRATVRTMKQNAIFALSTVAILMTGVSVGALFMAWGMLIHEVSILIVILNVTGLMRYAGPSKLFAPEPGPRRKQVS